MADGFEGGMIMIKGKKNSKSEDEHLSKAARTGKYRRREPPAPHVAGESGSHCLGPLSLFTI